MPEPSNERRPHISISETSTLQNRTGAWKYIRPRYRDGVAPCNAACPAGVDVEGYMNLLRDDRERDAIDLLLRENPMPAITGRVCHHPCELSCNRVHLDEAVAVHAVERALGDVALSSRPAPAARTRPETIAIIGSGPAGLACAYHLVRLGYGVTVFEEAAEAGGMLRLGIPPYRLPRDVLDRQIAWFTELGIDIRCSVRIDRDVGAQLDGFAAVFLATGAHVQRPLGVAGEERGRVLAGLDYLKAVNRGERPYLGRTVVIVGGGNTAIDCARTVRRLGAEPIVVYRRTRAEMPAIAAEVEEAIAEGIRFVFLAAPRVLLHTDGRLDGVECQRMVLGEPDASGRRRPVPEPDSTFTIRADAMLTAVGESTDIDALPPELANGNDAVAVDELGATSRSGYFAGGDLAGLTRTVADALGSGKAAAIGIDRQLRLRRGEAVAEVDVAALRWAGGSLSMSRWRNDDPVSRTSPANEIIGFDQLNVAHFERVPRNHDRHTVLSTDAADPFTEVNHGLALTDALEEARRCCNCGVCNQCELCMLLCPDVAIHRRGDGSGFDIDLDHCKGCGICAVECPRGALIMTREGL